VSGGVTNFYLVSESGKYTVVDAGAPHDWALLVASLKELGAQPTDVDAVLVTHAHADHIGFAEQARAEATAKVWIHEADADAAKTGKPSWKNEGSTLSYLGKAELWRTAFSLVTRGASKILLAPRVTSENAVRQSSALPR
jgi:glyoxylase-like metal-dependent hydrolase (beta-lactamase superfamily II)